MNMIYMASTKQRALRVGDEVLVSQSSQENFCRVELMSSFESRMKRSIRKVSSYGFRVKRVNPIIPKVGDCFFGVFPSRYIEVCYTSGTKVGLSHVPKGGGYEYCTIEDIKALNLKFKSGHYSSFTKMDSLMKGEEQLYQKSLEEDEIKYDP